MPSSCTDQMQPRFEDDRRLFGRTAKSFGYLGRTPLWPKGKRKLQILVGVCCLGLALLWIANNRNFAKEEADCREWKRTLERGAKVQALSSTLPEPLVRLLRLAAVENRYFERSESLQNALLSSGYLTNLCVALTNSSVTRYQIFSALQQAARGTSAEGYWSAGIRSNTLIVVTCRTKDSPLFIASLKE